MRLLVGTLYTIENEFPECRASIERQTHRELEHLVIRDLPKDEAHETLYGTFMERADEFDLLVKVDADMIVHDRELFRKIVQRFASDPELDLLLIAVDDHLLGRPVIGMNVFRNTVRWKLGNERLYTDMTYDRSTVRKTVKDLDDLAPAATHCEDPSPFQAFHFGFHRGMKVARGGSNVRMVDDVIQHYRRNRDSRVGFAVLGAVTAFTDRFGVEHISYTDETLRRYFDEHYGWMDAGTLHRAVLRSPQYWFFRLPIDRRILSNYYRLKKRARSG